MSPQQRKLLFGAAGALSLLAAWRVFQATDPQAGGDLLATAPRSSPSAAPRPRSNALPSAEICSTAELPARDPLTETAQADPFNAAPPPPPPVVAVAPPPPPPVVEAPPAPPPLPVLPYTYMGSLAASANGPAQVFLVYNERLLVAKAGDLLEGGYRLDQIGERELSFSRAADALVLKLTL